MAVTFQGGYVGGPQPTQLDMTPITQGILARNQRQDAVQAQRLQDYDLPGLAYLASTGDEGAARFLNRYYGPDQWQRYIPKPLYDPQGNPTGFEPPEGVPWDPTQRVRFGQNMLGVQPRQGQPEQQVIQTTETETGVNIGAKKKVAPILPDEQPEVDTEPNPPVVIREPDPPVVVREPTPVVEERQPNPNDSYVPPQPQPKPDPEPIPPPATFQGSDPHVAPHSASGPEVQVKYTGRGAEHFGADAHQATFMRLVDLIRKGETDTQGYRELLGRLNAVTNDGRSLSPDEFEAYAISIANQPQTGPFDVERQQLDVEKQLPTSQYNVSKADLYAPGDSAPIEPNDPPVTPEAEEHTPEGFFRMNGELWSIEEWPTLYQNYLRSKEGGDQTIQYPPVGPAVPVTEPQESGRGLIMPGRGLIAPGDEDRYPHIGPAGPLTAQAYATDALVDGAETTRNTLQRALPPEAAKAIADVAPTSDQIQITRGADPTTGALVESIDLPTGEQVPVRSEAAHTTATHIKRALGDPNAPATKAGQQALKQTVRNVSTQVVHEVAPRIQTGWEPVDQFARDMGNWIQSDPVAAGQLFQELSQWTIDAQSSQSTMRYQDALGRQADAVARRATMEADAIELAGGAEHLSEQNKLEQEQLRIANRMSQLQLDRALQLAGIETNLEEEIGLLSNQLRDSLRISNAEARAAAIDIRKYGFMDNAMDAIVSSGNSAEFGEMLLGLGGDASVQFDLILKLMGTDYFKGLDADDQTSLTNVMMGGLFGLEIGDVPRYNIIQSIIRSLEGKSLNERGVNPVTGAPISTEDRQREQAEQAEFLEQFGGHVVPGTR